MLVTNLIKDIEARTGLGKIMQAILAVALLTNVILAAALLTMDRTVRTIFVPPEITKSFWVDGRKLSPEYLEQMGDWVVYNFATVTPSSVDFKASQILKYVHPSVHGDLAIRFKAGALRLKHESMSRFFFPKDIRISEAAQAVAFIGAQESWIADKRLPGDAIKAYLVVFDWDGSRATIKELRETDPTHPFEPLTDQAVQAATVSAQQAAVSAPDQARSTVNESETRESLPPPPPSAASAETRSALQAGQLPKDTP